jgi:hypothetical protein
LQKEPSETTPDKCSNTGLYQLTRADCPLWCTETGFPLDTRFKENIEAARNSKSSSNTHAVINTRYVRGSITNIMDIVKYAKKGKYLNVFLINERNLHIHGTKMTARETARWNNGVYA